MTSCHPPGVTASIGKQSCCHMLSNHVRPSDRSRTSSLSTCLDRQPVHGSEILEFWNETSQLCLVFILTNSNEFHLNFVGESPKSRDKGMHAFPLISKPFFPTCQARVSLNLELLAPSSFLLLRARLLCLFPCQLQVSAGTAGPQPRAPDLGVH